MGNVVMSEDVLGDVIEYRYVGTNVVCLMLSVVYTCNYLYTFV